MDELGVGGLIEESDRLVDLGAMLRSHKQMQKRVADRMSRGYRLARRLGFSSHEAAQVCGWAETNIRRAAEDKIIDAVRVAREIMEGRG